MRPPRRRNHALGQIHCNFREYPGSNSLRLYNILFVQHRFQQFRIVSNRGKTLSGQVFDCSDQRFYILTIPLGLCRSGAFDAANATGNRKRHPGAQEGDSPCPNSVVH